MAQQRAGLGEATYQVRALERGLHILVVLARDSPSASLQDLHEATGLNKATLLRLLDVLLRSEFIEQNADDGSYHLGIRSFEVGMAYLPTLPIEQIAQPYLRKLMLATDLTANLGVLGGHEVVHIAAVAPERSLRSHIRIGYRDALHWTALGKVLAAGMTAEDLDQLLATVPLTRRTPATITDADAFRVELDRVRNAGVAYDIEEGSAGLSCMAAPVVDAAGKVIAAVSISGLSHEINERSRPELERHLKACAGAISHRFGHRAQELEPVSSDSGTAQ